MRHRHLSKLKIIMELVGLCLSLNTFAMDRYVSVLTREELTAIRETPEKSILLNQYYTGTYANTNCGPTALGMIFNHYNIAYTSIEDLRLKIRDADGAVWTNEIEDFLRAYGVRFWRTSLTDKIHIKEAIDHNRIVLLAIKMDKISYSTTGVGKTYFDTFNHYVVVSGYYMKDIGTCKQKLVFEILDPAVGSVSYFDSAELYKAIEAHWNYELVFGNLDDENTAPETVINIENKEYKTGYGSDADFIPSI